MLLLNYFMGYNFTFFNNYISSMLSFFNDYNYCLLLMILVFLVFSFMNLIYNMFYFKSFQLNYQMLEVMCAFLPIIIILMQLLPSLSLLFINNLGTSESHLTVKVVGSQWFWSFEILDFEVLSNNGVNFSSYGIHLDEISIKKNFNLLMKNKFHFLNNNFEVNDFTRSESVDNHLILPVNTNIKFLVTSSDVIHSFGSSNLGIKADAMSGILNSISVFFSDTGNYLFQCSEICGVGHSSMPANIEITTVENFFMKNILV